MSNTLRGGKNIYSPHSLQSNWFEERLEPGRQEAATDKVMQLPAATAKTWSKSSDEHGAFCKGEMDKRVTATATTCWMKYQEGDGSMYRTTYADAHCHPDDQVSVHKAPYIPEETLTAYRSKWTNGEPERFEKPKVGYQP
mmetsp:Transcript_60261/g.127641  ORF Transcript_60261/g.127641 Transcript_60261/m.127641 type:complete len:140 (-) Transcript_60261:69-488(-)|eukprot:CAMPEP_0206426774 /NCGR_PEP_ID=MMETSP0324_2-20121206/4598_1 /ASSEMBLY_ACC=CAM_ASM_000836 /TAXON_ID=2866 /ORGANISM="Crypthecodinium cohnii, Strain Seligo" /LENGTH=139 /DNA_ID=CAMNT_0053891833 /DNA_START=131 /DNA_END=550 /DNA_ORIENTATION=-